MTGDIIDAIMKESKAIPDLQVGTVILKTDFKLADIDSYSMPMLLFELLEGGESRQLIGGITRLDYYVALNVYAQAPDQLGDDTTGYSPSLLNIIDTIRVHFSNGRLYGWLTQGMTDILNNYGFRFSLGGIVEADALEGDGLLMGKRLVFETISFDMATCNNPQSTSPVTSVAQVGNPPY